MSFESWKKTTIGELCRFTNGNGFKPSDWSRRGLPIIRIQNLNGSGNFNYFSGSPDERWIVMPGDLLFAWAGTRGVSFGPTIWKGERGVLNQHIYKISPNDGVNRDWLYYALQVATARIETKAHGFKSTLLHVHKLEITRQAVFIPPSLEQQKIAETLSAWERAIENTRKLIVTKSKLNSALIREVITGKKRFREFAAKKWQRMKLSDFTSYKSRVKPKPQKPFTALGIRSHGKGTFLKPSFDPSKIEMMELFEVKENDLIVNITFAWEGAIAIVNATDDGALVSHRFPTYEFNTDLAVPEFFRHVIRQKRFIDRLGIISPGGAGRNRVLNKKDFGNLEVQLPSIAEQNRIATLLNACDQEIELMKKQLNALKRQKRGLMQKLLTGQIRMTLDGESNEELLIV